MKSPLKKILRRQIWAVVLLNIAQNSANFIREQFGRRKVFDIYTGNRDPAEEARYTLHMIHEYQRAAGGRLDVHDQIIIELGPGPFQAVALALYALGAEKVVSYDKYGFNVDPAFNGALHLALAGQLETNQRERLLNIIDPSSGDLLPAAAKHIIRVTGGSLKELTNAWRGKAGYVLSRSVLEYMDDLPGVLAACDDMLHGHGHMIHKIDLRDDGMFSLAGLDPLTFLRIPAPIYRLMISHTYRPRRWRPNHFIDFLPEHFAHVRFLVTRIIGEAKERSTWMSYPAHGEHPYTGPGDFICGGFLWASKK